MRQIRLRHAASLFNSNVDKLTDADEIPVQLCNYVDVYKNDKIDNSLDFMCASATPAEIERFGLWVGDVIITKDSEDAADIGVPAYVAETASDLVCGYHLTLLRSKSEVMRGDFLFWALNAKPVREQMSNAANGVTRFGLTLNGMKSVMVPAPNLETQKAIADFLDRETARIDQLIEKKERLVALLSEKRRSVVDWAVNGGVIEHPAPNPKIRYFLRPIATSSTTKNTVAQEPEEGLYPGFSASGQDVWLNYYDYEGPAIILSAVGAQCGKTFITDGKWGCVANTVGLSVMKGADARFFWYLTNSPDFWERGGAAQPYVKVSDTLRRRMPIPDLDTQKAIADLLDRETAKLSQAATAIAQSIDLLREYRAALITAAVTGQINVATWRDPAV